MAYFAAVRTHLVERRMKGKWWAKGRRYEWHGKRWGYKGSGDGLWEGYGKQAQITCRGTPPSSKLGRNQFPSARTARFIRTAINTSLPAKNQFLKKKNGQHTSDGGGETPFSHFESHSPSNSCGSPRISLKLNLHSPSDAVPPSRSWCASLIFVFNSFLAGDERGTARATRQSAQIRNHQFGHGGIATK